MSNSKENSMHLLTLMPNLSEHNTPDSSQLDKNAAKREYMRLKRLSMSPEKRAFVRALETERVRIRRMNRSSEEKDVDRQRDAYRMKMKRLEMSEEKKALIRLKNAERIRLKRQSQTPEERMMEKQKGAIAMRLRRLSMTEEERRMERFKNAERMRQKRRLQSPEERRMKRQQDAESKREKHVSPPPITEDQNSFRRLLETSEIREINLTDWGNRFRRMNDKHPFFFNSCCTKPPPAQNLEYVEVNVDPYYTS